MAIDFLDKLLPDNKKLIKLNDELKKKIAILPDEVKSSLTDLCDLLGSDKITEMPSGYLKHFIEFVKDLSGKLPKDPSVMLEEDLNDIKALFSSANNHFKEIKLSIENAVNITEMTVLDKEKLDIMKALRFTGIDIIKDGDIYREANSSDEPTGLNKKFPFGPATKATIDETVIDYLNDKVIALSPDGYKAEDYLKQIKSIYTRQLINKKSGGMDKDAAEEMAKKFDVDGIEFATFKYKDPYLRDTFMLEFFKNEYCATVCQNAYKNLDGVDSFSSFEDMKHIFIAKYSQSSINGNEIIKACQDTLKNVPENSAEKTALERVVYQFAVIKEICSKHSDILAKLDNKGIEEVFKHMDIGFDKRPDNPIKLNGPIRGLTDSDINTINTALDKLYPNFNPTKSLLRPDKIDQDVVVEKDVEEPIEEIEEIDDFDILGLVRDYACFDKTERIGIDEIYSPIKADSVAYNLLKIDRDKEYTYDDWSTILGIDLLEFISDKGKGSEESDFIKFIKDAKSNGNKLKLPDEMFVNAEAIRKDPEVLKRYAALVRYKNKLIEQGKKIEDISVDDMNKGLDETYKDIQANPPTEEEKAEAEKIRRKQNCLYASDLYNDQETSEEAKKQLSKIINDPELKNEKAELLERESKKSVKPPRTYAEIHGIVEKDGLAKKLKGYNKGYISGFIDDIIKTIKKTKVYELNKETPGTGTGGGTGANPGKETPTVPEKKDTPEEELSKLLQELLSLLKGKGCKIDDNLITKQEELKNFLNKSIDIFKKYLESIGEELKLSAEESKATDFKYVYIVINSIFTNISNIKYIKVLSDIIDALTNGKTEQEILDGLLETPKKDHDVVVEEKDDGNEIDEVIGWLDDHKNKILETSSLIDPKIKLNDLTRKMWFNLAAITGNDNEKLGNILKEVANGNFTKISQIIEKLHNTANQMDLKDKSENIHKVANDLKTYFNVLKDPKSDAAKAFRDIVYNGEGEFKLADNIDYVELIKLKTQDKKEEIKSKNEKYFDGVLDDIKKLKAIVGDKEAIDILGRLATASEVRLTGERTQVINGVERKIKKTQLIEEREYIVNTVNAELEKMKNEGKDISTLEGGFNNLLKLNPQVLLSVLSAVPNSVLGTSQVLDEKTCEDMMAVSAFDEDYNIENNIDTLVSVLGEDTAYNYLKALIREESANAVKKDLESKVNLPLDYLHNASNLKIKQILLEKGIYFDMGNNPESNNEEMLP